MQTSKQLKKKTKKKTFFLIRISVGIVPLVQNPADISLICFVLLL